MRHLFHLLLFLAFASFGQNQTDRCATQFPAHSAPFETWLQQKRASFRLDEEVVYTIPVVVHVLHLGEPIGQGSNLSLERIQSQIRILNEDYRRKLGTRGYNTNPVGGDARIEFVLAKTDPDGQPTDGIVRKEASQIPVLPGDANIIDYQAFHSYWDPERYLNIWSTSQYQVGSFLGMAKFPLADLPGMSSWDDGHADGVTIDAEHFGEITTTNYPYGRTGTHEIGHFLGLLHTWGNADSGSESCSDATDYCEDTPPVNRSTSGCPSTPPLACNGQGAMMENYMDYSYDRCMNIFTNDQIGRMRTVLENSPRRKSLLTSPALNEPDPLSLTPPEKGWSVNVQEGQVIIEHPSLPVADVEATCYSFSGTIIPVTIVSKSTTRVVAQLPASSEAVNVLRLRLGATVYTKKIIKYGK